MGGKKNYTEHLFTALVALLATGWPLLLGNKGGFEKTTLLTFSILFASIIIIFAIINIFQKKNERQEKHKKEHIQLRKDVTEIKQEISEIKKKCERECDVIRKIYKLENQISTIMGRKKK